jgi:hypothetical protein
LVIRYLKRQKSLVKQRSFIWRGRSTPYASPLPRGARDEVGWLFGEKTLMFLFPVSEEKNRWLKERMKTLRIYEKDIEEKFIRSSGSGGQKVNKTSTCVYLKHIPTGIEIKWMRERNQSLNRFLARRELVMRIEKLSGQLAPEEVKIEKVKRQKLKRKKRARLKYGGGE